MANLVSRAGKKFIRTARRVQKRLSPRGHILMYHSIGDSEMDPWSMQVNPPHFEEHLEVIKRIARPVSIAQLASMQKEGRVEPNSVAITFDDGYVNNYTVAKPLLEKHELHAMVYAVPGFVRTGKPFWWDQLQAVLLKPGKLPGELKLTVSGKDKYWNLGEAVDYSYEQAREDHHQHPWSA
ncbi:MAG: polysaccharide deacetylase family protein, partial [Verrucomicrobiae bacterium]|nr:polysaccharide deacetylase family protein [Verrucomicrobiae bacterium]